MKIRNNILFLGGLIFVAIPCSYFYFGAVGKKYRSITSFDDCVKAGYRVKAIYPETCSLPGKVFSNEDQQKKETSTVIQNEPVIQYVSDYSNADYFLEGQRVLLRNGRGFLQRNEPQQIATSTVEQVGQPLYVDLNNDNATDTIFILRSSIPSSKKIRYYVAAYTSLYKGYSGLNGLYINDNLKSIRATFADPIVSVTYTTETSGTLTTQSYILENSILKEMNK